MLQNTINSYLYTQYADDDDLQAFVATYNEMAQGYVNWFATVALPYYPGLSGSLLDWVAQGLYGMTRPAFASQISTAIGPLNSFLLNAVPLNYFSPGSITYYVTTDDDFKRILTWNFYKADGKYFTMRWLKRRIMRFLLGVNGLEPRAGQPEFVVGVENTTPVSVTVATISGILTLTVTINQAALSALTEVTPGILNIFQAAFMSGVLELPIQYTYAVNIA